MPQKKRKASSKKSNIKKEEVCEIFEKQKDGKETEIESCGVQEVEEVKKGQMEQQNKILRNVLIIIGISIVFFLAVWWSVNSIRHFEYKNAQYDVVKEQNLILYNTKLKMMQGEKHVADYNFYLRNDPRKLNDIEFTGEILLAKNIVVNSESDFTCEGDGTIGLANLVKLFGVLNFNVLADKNATCVQDASYSIIEIVEGNETKITQYGPSCYKMEVKGCEILEATEKFMVETFAKINANSN